MSGKLRAFRYAFRSTSTKAELVPSIQSESLIAPSTPVKTRRTRIKKDGPSVAMRAGVDGPKAGVEAERAVGAKGAHLGKNTKKVDAKGQNSSSDAVLGCSISEAKKLGFSAEEKKIQRREARAQRISTLRKIQPLMADFKQGKRVSKCTRVSIMEGGGAQVRLKLDAEGNRFAGIGGVLRCGAIWACPTCSAKIVMHRAFELDKVIRWNLERNGSVALATFTISHKKYHTLRKIRDGISHGWSGITRSRIWRKLRKELGLDHYVRGIECTITEENGWHLHIHALFLFDGPISQETMESAADSLYNEWSRGLDKVKLKASRKRGIDIQVGREAVEKLGRYLSKMALETAASRIKKRKNNSHAGRTPWEVLDDFVTTGNADEWDIWKEWVKGSKGMHQLHYSHGLRKLVFSGEKQLSDEQVVQIDEGGQNIAELSPVAWKHVYQVLEYVLALTEDRGPEGLYDWLDQHKLGYDIPRIS